MLGEGGEAVEVVARFQVDEIRCLLSGWVAASATAVLAISVGCPVFFIIPAVPLPLSRIASAVSVVDAGMQISLVKVGPKVVLIDVLSRLAMSCRVVA